MKYKKILFATLSVVSSVTLAMLGSISAAYAGGPDVESSPQHFTSAPAPAANLDTSGLFILAGPNFIHSSDWSNASDALASTRTTTTTTTTQAQPALYSGDFNLGVGYSMNMGSEWDAGVVLMTEVIPHKYSDVTESLSSDAAQYDFTYKYEDEAMFETSLLFEGAYNVMNTDKKKVSVGLQFGPSAMVLTGRDEFTAVSGNVAANSPGVHFFDNRAHRVPLGGVLGLYTQFNWKTDEGGRYFMRLDYLQGMYATVRFRNSRIIQLATTTTIRDALKRAVYTSRFAADIGMIF